MKKIGGSNLLFNLIQQKYYHVLGNQYKQIEIFYGILCAKSLKSGVYFACIAHLN